jgi:hypothetical protein
MHATCDSSIRHICSDRGGSIAELSERVSSRSIITATAATAATAGISDIEGVINQSHRDRYDSGPSKSDQRVSDSFPSSLVTLNRRTSGHQLEEAIEPVRDSGEDKEPRKDVPKPGERIFYLVDRPRLCGCCSSCDGDKHRNEEAIEQQPASTFVCGQDCLQCGYAFHIRRQRLYILNRFAGAAGGIEYIFITIKKSRQRKR